MQTYMLEIQDEALPQFLAMLQKKFTTSVKIKPQPIKKPLEKVEQKTDLDLNEDYDSFSSLDYLAVSNDRTDENWLKNLFSLMDKASQQPTVILDSKADRGWTRDEIYER